MYLIVVTGRGAGPKNPTWVTGAAPGGGAISSSPHPPRRFGGGLGDPWLAQGAPWSALETSRLPRMRFWKLFEVGGSGRKPIESAFTSFFQHLPTHFATATARWCHRRRRWGARPHWRIQEAPPHQRRPKPPRCYSGPARTDGRGGGDEAAAAPRDEGHHQAGRDVHRQFEERFTGSSDGQFLDALVTLGFSP